MGLRLRYALVVIVAVGGALRFATLGERSFWRDEVFTVELVRRGFGSMLGAIPAARARPRPTTWLHGDGRGSSARAKSGFAPCPR